MNRADKLLSAAVAHVQNSGIGERLCVMGTVSAVDGVGRITVDRLGESFPSVRVVGGYPPVIGDTVQIFRTLGGWICLGALALHDTRWQYPSLYSPFTNHAGWQSARFRRTGHEVEIQGLVDSHGATGDPDVFDLPPGFRPSSSLMFAVATSYGYQQLRVYDSGPVRMQGIGGDSGSYLSLNVRFSID